MQDSATVHSANFSITALEKLLYTVDQHISRFESVRLLSVEGTERQSLCEQSTFLTKAER